MTPLVHFILRLTVAASFMAPALVGCAIHGG